MSHVLRYLLEETKPIFSEEQLKVLPTMEKDRWMAIIKRRQGTLITYPGKVSGSPAEMYAWTEPMIRVDSYLYWPKTMFQIYSGPHCLYLDLIHPDSLPSSPLNPARFRSSVSCFYYRDSIAVSSQQWCTSWPTLSFWLSVSIIRRFFACTSVPHREGNRVETDEGVAKDQVSCLNWEGKQGSKAQ